MLKLKSIEVILGGGTKLERKILNNLNLQVNIGEFIVIIGGNGAGKSTMFNVISGFINPCKGEIILDNIDITNRPQYSKSADIAKVMQNPMVGTIEKLTIYENMALSYMRGIDRNLSLYDSKKRRELFKEKLSMLEMGLENRLEDKVSNLSGGQRQALSIIMSIIRDSKILLLDEITAALDPKTAEIVMKIAARIIQEEKRTSIMITHNMSHAIKYGDRILLLNNGSFIKEFSNAEKEKLLPLDLIQSFEDI
jgi:putative tryptophan/tyrosine transport system ATP-binding protein